MSENYILMHKDLELGKLIFHSDTGMLIDASLSDTHRKHLPYRAAFGFKELSDWWSNRAIPRTRKSLRKYLEQHNVDSVEQHLLDNLGLSLNDCWWIRPEKSSFGWHDVNFFENPFPYPSEIIVRHHAPDPSSHDLTPDASTGGDLSKWWVIDNGERYLLKGNPDGVPQQCYNEVLATMIHERQGFGEYVAYSITKLPNGLTGTKCKAFTSANSEFISAWDLIGKVKLSEKAPVKGLFIQACVDGGLDRTYVERFLDYMALTDILISNTDRHLNNFGVMRNPETLEFTSMAPIFDSGNSMMFRDSYATSLRKALDEEQHGFYRTSRGIVEHIKNKQLLDINKLPSKTEVLNLYNKDKRNMSESLARLYVQKTGFLKGLQTGRSYYDLYSNAGRKGLSRF